MSIRHLSICISLCILLSAPYALAGGIGSKSKGKSTASSNSNSNSRPTKTPDTPRSTPTTPRETIPKLAQQPVQQPDEQPSPRSPRLTIKIDENWRPEKGDKMLRIEKEKNTEESGFKISEITIEGYMEKTGDVVTTQLQPAPVLTLARDWAIVDPENALYEVCVSDEKNHPGMVLGFYNDGTFLLSGPHRLFKTETHYWRAKEAKPLLDHKPLTCVEHRCPLNTCEHGNNMCEKCLALGDPLTCASCLAVTVTNVVSLREEV